ncbi:MAG: hypothetical protein AVDCRST_MAG93-8590, partial [uncultured Chloroflexia bacterium]
MEKGQPTQQQMNERSAMIRQEAAQILHAEGLLALLQGIGEPFVGGSYFYDLMCWRDLDIYVCAPDITIERFFTLGAAVTE